MKSTSAVLPTLLTPPQVLAYLGQQRARDPRLARLMRFYAGDAWVGEDGKRIRLRPIGVSEEVGGLIHWLVSQLPPGPTVETGFGFGVSAGYFALALHASAPAHRCFDLWLEWAKGTGQRLLRELGVTDRVIVHNELSQLGLTELLRRDENSKVRVALMDGSLMFDELMTDFSIMDRLLAPESALLIRHSYLPQVQTLLSYIKNNHDFAVEPWSGEMTVLRRKGRRARSWNHFVPFDVPHEGNAERGGDGLLKIDAPDGGSFLMPDEPGMAHHLQRVLNGGEYPLLFSDVYQASTVLDVGGHVGSAARFFAACYPRARILSIEPTPESFTLHKANTEHLSGVERFNIAFANTPGMLRIWRGRYSSGQNSARPNEENRDNFFDAATVVPSAFCAEQGLDAISILKIDIEGMELDVLRNLQPMFERIDVIYLEYHSEQIRLDADALLRGTFTLFASNAAEAFRGTVAYARSSLLAALREKSAAARYVFPKQV